MQPQQGGPYIFGVTCQAIHPQMLLMTEQLRLTLLGKREVVHRMQLPCRLQLSRIHKCFQVVLPDRFEHQQTRLISPSVALLQQAFVEQGGDQVYSGKRVIRFTCGESSINRDATDSFGSLKHTTADKDGHAPETPLLLDSQEIITPANGITQGVLPGGSILPATRQHSKPLGEPSQQCLGRQQVAPCPC